MKLEIEINEEDLKALILDYIFKEVGNIEVALSDIKIEVKSKQNYNSEWETAAFRATVTKL